MNELAHASALSRWFNSNGWRQAIIATPYLWLFVFVFIPFLIIVWISLGKTYPASPPFAFKPEFPWIHWEGYQRLFTDSLYVRAYLISVYNAAIATLLCLLVGYPMALGLTRVSRSWRSFLLILVILPFWTSFLIRVYAWIGILKPEGLLNQFLMALGVISEPLQILNTHTAIFIGIVYSYLPFMVLPIYSTLEKMDYSLIEAAQDLGCPPVTAFWKITLPLAIPGILAGCLLVFIPAVGEFVIPDLLGGSRTLMIGKTLWSEFFNNRDWPLASAVAIILLLLLVVPIVMFQNAQARAQEAGK